MTSTPWRRGATTKLEADYGVEHTESASVPVTPAAGDGVFWVRSDSPNVPMFTDDDGTDWVLNVGSQWKRETSSTTGASASNTISTPVSALADGDQTAVEVWIFGVDAADATNTYFRRQLVTYYRDGGSTTQWTIEESGAEQRRGTLPGTLTVGLTTSTNDVIVNADTTGVGGGVTIDWTVLYLTRGTITDGVSSGGGGGGGGGLTFTATKTANYTASAGEAVLYDPSGGTFTLSMPGSPATDDQVGIKNAGTSATAVTLSGNGNNVEDPSSPGSVAASVSVSGGGVSIIYQFDGTQWWIV